MAQVAALPWGVGGIWGHQAVAGTLFSLGELGHSCLGAQSPPQDSESPPTKVSRTVPTGFALCMEGLPEILFPENVQSSEYTTYFNFVPKRHTAA